MAAEVLSASSASLASYIGQEGEWVGPSLRLLLAVSLEMMLLALTAGAAAPTINDYRAGITADSGPEGIAAGPDGNLWFTEYNGARVAKITATGVVTEYRAGLTAHSQPNAIAAGRTATCGSPSLAALGSRRSRRPVSSPNTAPASLPSTAPVVRLIPADP
jgi:hypothetical protein